MSGNQPWPRPRLAFAGLLGEAQRLNWVPGMRARHREGSRDMDGRRRRALSASLVTMAAVALATAPAALASGVTVASLSSLKAGASAGTLRGQVANQAAKGTRARIEVRLNRYGTKRAIV